MNEEPLTELAKGFRKRTWVTAKLATRMGMKMAKRTFIGGSGDAPDEQQAIEAAKQWVSQVGALKGLAMKVGQMASYLPGALPEAAQDALAQLQAESTAMAWDQVAKVIEEQLGTTPESLFEQIDPEPFAAASIGQVHRARFEERDVVVKIQYPGIEDLMRSDMKTVGIMARMSTLGTASDGKALADELAARILEECDYELEAKNQEVFRELLGDVPRVVSERSTKRVLTTELVEGMRFAQFVESASQEAKDRAGERIFDACMGILFRHAIFNGDPHPGNYLFDAEGKVTFLDFGCVRRFDIAMMDQWKRMALTVLDDDFEGFRREWPKLGFVPQPHKLDWDYQWEAVLDLYLPLKTPGFRFTDEYVQNSYGLQVFDNPNKMRLRMGPEWLLLNRLQWGLYAILAKLDAAGDWPALFRSAVESETTPR